MRSSRIRAARAVVALLTSGALAATAIGALASSADASSGPTLKANKHIAGFAAVAYGRGIELSGRASGGSQPYALQAERWPFKGGFQTIAHGSTNGRYSFVVRPVRATRYRISVGSSSSRVLPVYVLERNLSSSCNLCNAQNVSGTYTLVINGTYVTPPGAKVTGPVYFYYGAATNATAGPTYLNLVQSVPRYFARNRFSLTIQYTVEFPVGQFAFSTDYCWKENERKTGVGLPGNHGCGNATINRFSYAG